MKWKLFFSLELLSSLNYICSNISLTPFPLGNISVFSSMKIYLYEWNKCSNSISCYLGSQQSCDISWFEYNSDRSYTIFFSLHFFETDKTDENVFIIGHNGNSPPETRDRRRTIAKCKDGSWRHAGNGITVMRSINHIVIILGSSTLVLQWWFCRGKVRIWLNLSIILLSLFSCHFFSLSHRAWFTSGVGSKTAKLC